MPAPEGAPCGVRDGFLMAGGPDGACVKTGGCAPGFAPLGGLCVYPCRPGTRYDVDGSCVPEDDGAVCGAEDGFVMRRRNGDCRRTAECAPGRKQAGPGGAACVEAPLADGFEVLQAPDDAFVNVRPLAGRFCSVGSNADGCSPVGVVPAESVGDCAAQCRAQPRCGAFTFYTTGGHGDGDFKCKLMPGLPADPPLRPHPDKRFLTYRALDALPDGTGEAIAPGDRVEVCDLGADGVFRDAERPAVYKGLDAAGMAVFTFGAVDVRYATANGAEPKYGDALLRDSPDTPLRFNQDANAFVRPGGCGAAKPPAGVVYRRGPDQVMPGQDVALCEARASPAPPGARPAKFRGMFPGRLARFDGAGAEYSVHLADGARSGHLEFGSWVRRVEPGADADRVSPGARYAKVLRPRDASSCAGYTYFGPPRPRTPTEHLRPNHTSGPARALAKALVAGGSCDAAELVVAVTGQDALVFSINQWTDRAPAVPAALAPPYFPWRIRLVPRPVHGVPLFSVEVDDAAGGTRPLSVAGETAFGFVEIPGGGAASGTRVRLYTARVAPRDGDRYAPRAFPSVLRRAAGGALAWSPALPGGASCPVRALDGCLRALRGESEQAPACVLAFRTHTP